MKNNVIGFLPLALGFFLLDRLTKYLSLALPETGVFYFPGFGLKLYLNPGLAFSLPMPLELIAGLIIIILITLIIVWAKWYQEEKFFLLWPLSLIILGALSNLLDRFKFGAVIDFIDLWLWPAFNLADIYIVAGCLWLLVKLLPKESK